MIDIREFIRNLGDGAPDYFGVHENTIKRWVKTGNVPIKVAQKIFAAQEAITKSQAPGPDQRPPLAPAQEQAIDPITHLPVNMARVVPQATAGRPPDWIEPNPQEQSFGNNFTRPGRIAQPLPPMKLRDEGGQKVAYRQNTPPLSEQENVALPPSISKSAGGWSEPKSDEPKPAETAPEGVS